MLSWLLGVYCGGMVATFPSTRDVLRERGNARGRLAVVMIVAMLTWPLWWVGDKRPITWVLKWLPFKVLFCLLAACDPSVAVYEAPVPAETPSQSAEDGSGGARALMTPEAPLEGCDGSGGDSGPEEEPPALSSPCEEVCEGLLGCGYEWGDDCLDACEADVQDCDGSDVYALWVCVAGFAAGQCSESCVAEVSCVGVDL